MTAATRSIDVAFTRAEARPCEVAIVVDVLRATSTVAAALAAGYERVLIAESVERALELRAPGRVLAGERDCVRPPGFDLGNSPAALDPPAGRELVLATTNGAPTVLAAAACAEHVLLAALVNLDAVVAAVGAGDVQIVCSGTDRRPALEDAYAAGRIAAALAGEPTDAARIAVAVAAGCAGPHEALSSSEDAAVLRRVGQEADIAWCARTSELAVVPVVSEARDGVAYIEFPLSDSPDISLDVLVTGGVRSPA